MSELVLVIGAIAGVTLSGLLACTIVKKELQFWPTPGKGSWQSRVFWALFRTLNVSTLALAYLDWQRWDGFSLERGLGATLAILGFALYGWAVYALGRRNVYCGRDGSSRAVSIAGRGTRNTQRPSRPISPWRLLPTRLQFLWSRRCSLSASCSWRSRKSTGSKPHTVPITGAIGSKWLAFMTGATRWRSSGTRPWGRRKLPKKSFSECRYANQLFSMAFTHRRSYGAQTRAVFWPTR